MLSRTSYLKSALRLHKLQRIQIFLRDLDNPSDPGTPHKTLHTSSSQLVGYKIKDNVSDCYSLLSLKEGCDYQQLKDAYIRLAKIYHPDSGSKTADTKKFTQVQLAYRTVKEHMKNNEEDDVEIDEPEIVFDIRHTAPQHRQYLSYDGVGFGTPSQRQRQYQQQRVAKASESVSDHRIQKIAVQYEDALVVKDKQAVKKHKTQNYMDRLVEDLIKEAMEKGDFKDLPGKGKPLGYTERNPFVDSTTHNLNKILINDGFAPGWIALEKDIRQDIRRSRETLAKERSYLGSPPLSPADNNRWVHYCKNFRMSLDDINERIRRYNMVVPFIRKQLVEYQVEKEIKQIFTNWEDFLPTDFTPGESRHTQFTNNTDKILWSEIWRHIKSVFSSTH